MSRDNGGHCCFELTGTLRAEWKLDAKAAEWLLEIRKAGWFYPSCGLGVRVSLSTHWIFGIWMCCSWWAHKCHLAEAVSGQRIPVASERRASMIDGERSFLPLERLHCKYRLKIEGRQSYSDLQRAEKQNRASFWASEELLLIRARSCPFYLLADLFGISSELSQGGTSPAEATPAPLESGLILLINTEQ